VRAGAKRLGSKKNMSKPILRDDGSEAHRYFCTTLAPLTASRHADFIYPTVVYELSDVLNDLMEFAAAHLRLGGRLVFWLPLIRDTNHEPRIPHHANLMLVSKCEQLFNQCMYHPCYHSDSVRVSESFDIRKSRESRLQASGYRGASGSRP
jgi:tRNA (guanine10-N2)-methyltransferase